MSDNFHIGSKSKIHIHWRVSPYDYSKDKEDSIIFQASQKYSIPKDKIKVIPEFIVLNKKGEEMSIAHEVIQNIQKPDFQVQLFKKYLITNNIKGFDFDFIQSIDSEINAQINYDVYDRYRKYKLKWVKWKNFLSYGDGNFYDFSNLNGLVLLNGEPANQSGKTTFAIDLIHFLFFGKTEKYPTQDKIFNKHIDEATEVVVEGCIEIDGQEYVIKRRLSRPSLSKRSSKSKTVQKVEYFKVNNGELSSLEDFTDNYQEENSIQTNKVIKEAIGNEGDFDMIVCATSKNLDDLIEKKETERGRLLSRWIGLLPIEQKEQIAKEKFNTDIKPFLLSTRYNREELEREIELLKQNIESLKQSIKHNEENTARVEKEIEVLEQQQNTLSALRINIDDSVLKLDINTLKTKLQQVTELGIQKKNELKVIDEALSELEDINFSIEEYNNTTETKNKLIEKIAEVKAKCITLQNTIKELKTSEYCPTCGRKYDNIDNTAKISELTAELENLIQHGKGLKESLDKVEVQLESMKVLQEKYLRKCKLQVQRGAVEVSIEQCRNTYIESTRLLNEYNKNTEAIDKNNQLNIQINNNNVLLKNKRLEKDVLLRNNIQLHTEITNHQNGIGDREEIIAKLSEEVKKVYNWKLYLEMIGKNGISKMLLRQVIPVINAQISALLNDVCDFTVELSITDKNDVVFHLLKDGVRSDLSGGSGFERTASALALRSVLGNISTLPRMSSLVLDEIWGRVAKENYDNLRKLLEEISKSFDFILLISHLDEVKDFCDTIITVVKENNISTIKTERNVVIK